MGRIGGSLNGESGAGSIGRAFSATALPKASRMICRKSLVAWAASFDIFPSILSYDFFAFLFDVHKDTIHAVEAGVDIQGIAASKVPPESVKSL